MVETRSSHLWPWRCLCGSSWWTWWIWSPLTLSPTLHNWWVFPICVWFPLLTLTSPCPWLWACSSWFCITASRSRESAGLWRSWRFSLSTTRRPSQLTSSWKLLRWFPNLFLWVFDCSATCMLANWSLSWLRVCYPGGHSGFCPCLGQSSTSWSSLCRRLFSWFWPSCICRWRRKIMVDATQIILFIQSITS